ncbi:MAG TPA: gamma-glutamyltransferase [Bdellovibrionota bacterium]
MLLISALLPAILSSCALVRPCEWGEDRCEWSRRNQPVLPEGVSAEDAAASSTHHAMGYHYAIATQGAHASTAADEMFSQGGNIIDAAVAVSFAISVERPQSTGIGGGGFLLFHDAKTGKTYAADFRERAPLLASRNMYLDAKGEVIPGKSLNGALSVATPGLVAGLVEIQKKWGKLSLAQVIAPAIRIAEQGFKVPASLARALEWRKGELAKDPAAKAIFLHADGSPYKEDEILVQKDLAQTLKGIAFRGRAGFYKGKVAKAIVEGLRQQGGILRQKDLDQYKLKWREPVHGTFGGLELFSMPPPSSGGIHVLQILNMLENEKLGELGFFSAQAIHRTAAAMQLAFADRAVYPGDPDFVKVPTKKLISKAYALERRLLIDEKRAKPSSEIQAGNAGKAESPETTHFSLMDAGGNAVSSTQTINYGFGSAVVAPGTGVLLNDEMDDFSVKPGAPNAYGAVGGEANAIAPGKTPLSSMSPTIILQNGKAIMAVGAPGGTRIITCVAQTILNRFAYGMTNYNAVASMRIHHQWLPDQLEIEMPGPSPSVRKELEQMGYRLKVEPRVNPCRTESVERQLPLEDGNKLVLFSASDPRDSGRALAK